MPPSKRRAGEAGRSFAVVASDVRMLAQRYAAASKEIKSVVGMSATKVAAGTELVARTTSQMRVIDEAVGRASSIIAEVANVGSQAEGIRQVNRAVSHVDGPMQRNLPHPGSSVTVREESPEIEQEEAALI
jgi:aerotaxis receptor